MRVGRPQNGHPALVGTVDVVGILSRAGYEALIFDAPDRLPHSELAHGHLSC